MAIAEPVSLRRASFFLGATFPHVVASLAGAVLLGVTGIGYHLING